MLALDVKTLLPNEILYFNDLLSMTHSLEVRTPFLDYRLVEFAFGLPGTLKIRDGVLKYLLRKVAERYLPAEVINRPKEGFVLPNNTWFRGPMSADLVASLDTANLDRLGLFNSDYVKELVRTFLSGDDSVTFKLYTLYVLQHWFEVWT
jgi:asparagine synthase (glutamine-hydrolysing)